YASRERGQRGARQRGDRAWRWRRGVGGPRAQAGPGGDRSTGEAEREQRTVAAIDDPARGWRIVAGDDAQDVAIRRDRGCVRSQRRGGERDPRAGGGSAAGDLRGRAGFAARSPVVDGDTSRTAKVYVYLVTSTFCW